MNYILNFIRFLHAEYNIKKCNFFKNITSKRKQKLNEVSIFSIAVFFGSYDENNRSINSEIAVLHYKGYVQRASIQDCTNIVSKFYKYTYIM